MSYTWVGPECDNEIVELDLLAKYTHYCQICGNGLKRDANLRMHMRVHGDGYKSGAAFSNPINKNIDYLNGVGGIKSMIRTRLFWIFLTN